MKRCSVCRQTLSLDDFSRDASRVDGRMVRCRRCDSARNVAYYRANRVEVLERKAKYRTTGRKRVVLPKACKGCGNVNVFQARHWYCEVCRAIALEKRRRRERHALSAAERGYDAGHQAERRRVRKLVEAAGGAVCARCGGWISALEPWDLGHDDNDRSRYVGPEHRRCNRATASRHKRRSVPRVASRVW